MKIKLPALMFLLLCSCGGETAEEGTDQVIRIDLLSEPKSTVTKLSDFAEKVEYIPLQTTRESLISKARRIISVGDKFYVYNALVNEILCFDLNGNFLFKLDKEGRGPGEYTGIFYHDVSPDNKYLAVLDVTHKLHVYSISETGFTFEKSIPMGNPSPMKLGMVPGTDYLFLAHRTKIRDRTFFKLNDRHERGYNTL